MRIIGVTGGVGSGKSAVLNYLEEHFDSRVVKADEVGHLLMMPGRECYEPIIELFGEWVVKEIERSRKEETEFFFIEAALLLEEKYDEICDEVWYIYCEKEVRKERLRHDRGYSDEKIESLMKNQLSEEEFESRCDFQIYNSEDVAYTYLQIERRMRMYYEFM